MKWCIFLMSLLNVLFLSGQSHNLPQFPNDWFGLWQGNLEVYNHQNLSQNVPMTLECFPTDSSGVYTWWITYGTDTLTGKRSYSLKVIDNTKGHFIIDENNGILIDGYVMANKFISRFEVMGNQLTAIYERTDDKMIFEIIFNDTKEIKNTGNITSPTGEKIPEVKAFKLSGYQRAVLNQVH